MTKWFSTKFNAVGLLCLSFSLNLSPAFADFEMDSKAILQQVGCYKLHFDYADVNASKMPEDSDFQFKDYEADRSSNHDYAKFNQGAYELIVRTETKDGSAISLQHLLFIHPHATFYIKHGRQEWKYEAETVLEYQPSYRWLKRRLEPSVVAGTWVQRLYRTDDGPYHQSVSTWIHDGPVHSWKYSQSQPMPRRDKEKNRADYNLMRVIGTYEIQDGSPTWKISEKNEKIMDLDGEKKPVVREVGGGVYTKVEDGFCDGVKAEWEKDEKIWSQVRQVWEKYLESAESIEIKNESDMRAELNSYAKKHSGTSEDHTQEIEKIILKFVSFK